MTEPVQLGIDWSEGGCRAVYLDDVRPKSLALPPQMRFSMLAFDPNANISSIGVGFPSLNHFMGSHQRFSVNARLESSVISREESAESFTSRCFGWISQSVREASGRAIGATVLAVPVTLSHAGRQALLACAREASLDRVTLLDRSTAAALGYHASGRDKSVTALVVNLDYGDCEYGVIRLARGRHRVVAAGSVPQVSGQMLDALLIETIVLALRKESIFLGLRQMPPDHWLDLRHIANSARLELSRWPETEAILPPSLTDLDGPVHVRLRRDSLESKVKSTIGQAIETIHGVLEQNGLELDDIDAFLLVGREASNSPVRDLLHQAFRGKPMPTDPDLVAIGAAWYARSRATILSFKGHPRPQRSLPLPMAKPVRPRSRAGTSKGGRT